MLIRSERFAFGHFGRNGQEECLRACFLHLVEHTGNKEYRLCLPLEQTTTFISQQDSILAYNAKQLIHDRRSEIDMAQKTGIAGGYMVNGKMYYKIRQGDTLGSIAKKFHVTVSQLQRWNGLTSTNIYTGKNLRVSP